MGQQGLSLEWRARLETLDKAPWEKRPAEPIRSASKLPKSKEAAHSLPWRAYWEALAVLVCLAFFFSPSACLSLPKSSSNYRAAGGLVGGLTKGVGGVVSGVGGNVPILGGALSMSTSSLKAFSGTTSNLFRRGCW